MFNIMEQLIIYHFPDPLADYGIPNDLVMKYKKVSLLLQRHFLYLISIFSLISL